MFINLVHTFCYSTELCTERFELPHSLRTSKKKLAHIKNINIWSYNLKFSEKFYTSSYVQGARKKLKIASLIEHA